MKEMHDDRIFPAKDGRGNEGHFSEYIDVLYKRKNFVFLFFIIFVSLVTYRTYQTVPLFQSSAKLVIDAKSLHSPISGKRMEIETNMGQVLDMGTHFRLIKSKPVIRSVIEDLNFNDENTKKEQSLVQRFKGQIVQTIKSIFPEKKEKNMATSIDPATRKMKILVKRLQGKIGVKQVKKTRLILVSAKDKDPNRAAEIANSVANKYIEFDQSNRILSSGKNLEWLNNELYVLKKELEDNEKAFFEYKTKNKVFSMVGKQKMVDQKIAEFNNKYLEARNKRLDFDLKIDELKRHIESPDGLVNVRSLLNNSLIEEIYNKIVNLEIEQTKLAKVYKSKHPKIIQIKSEIEKSRLRLDFELEKEISNLRSERSVIAAREKSLEKTIVEFEKDALESSGNELKYTILQRNVKTSHDLYNVLLSRIKESDILKNNASSNIRIVERAEATFVPVSPKKRRNLFFGIIFGLLGGCLLAFFFEYMDQTLRTQEDVESYLNLPVLSVIPEADKRYWDGK